MGIELYEQQLNAIDQMKNGCILAGDVGTGKSRTSIAYYYLKVCDGGICVNGKGTFKKFRYPKDLYIITTAKKRDSLEWNDELKSFRLTVGRNDIFGIDIQVDSWNNIHKYVGVGGAFFIFDEQRVVGSGTWVKSFLTITKKNQWILLSATPGDTWTDYIPVFIANGFYKNKTDFTRQHCVFSRFSKYPKIERFVDQGILIKHRNDILVRMSIDFGTVRHKHIIPVEYDRVLYRTIWRDRWDPFDDEPIEETGKLFYLLRRVTNGDNSRRSAVLDILKEHPRVIIFYNFTYELNVLRECLNGLSYDFGEWNGEVHSDVPEGERWAYLVQYTAGCEGWNCITTDTIIFYSQSYSYRMTEQAMGRIDRVNTEYKDLHYYFLKSTAPIDIAIARALSQKKNFNERSFKGR